MSSTAFDVSLIPWQQTVWDSSARFNVIAAGRRCGKTQFVANKLLVKGLTCPSRTGKVFYIAPTQGQARDLMWDLLHEVGEGLITASHINNQTVTLINGVTIALKGADNPKNLRGVSLWYCALDEYADMKPEIWEQILRPALSDLEGEADFIGTPMGRNHFYDLYMDAKLGDDPDFDAHHYTSWDNPFLKRTEIEAAKRSMSSHNFRQEYEASFEAMGSAMFEADWVRFAEEEPQIGDWYITVDPAGFQDAAKASNKNSRLDETAIACVKVGPDGWYVGDIIHGRWTLDETADKIFAAVVKYRPLKVGIERGIAQQAILSPLQNLMRRNRRHFNIELLTHGNQKKTDRIMWALQGRFEHGDIELSTGDWNVTFLDQLYQFPSKLTHDDLVDALAYIDQLAIEIYDESDYDDDFDDWSDSVDEYAGY